MQDRDLLPGVVKLLAVKGALLLCLWAVFFRNGHPEITTAQVARHMSASSTVEDVSHGYR